MTGKIRTLRVDKGFGFIKGDGGNEYFFTRVRCMARGSGICVRVTASSSTLAKDQKARVPRTSGARPPKDRRTKACRRRGHAPTRRHGDLRRFELPSVF